MISYLSDNVYFQVEAPDLDIQVIVINATKCGYINSTSIHSAVVSALTFPCLC